MRFGEVGTRSLDTSYKHPHADIAVLRIHNHISMPLEVFSQGYKLAAIAPDDGLSYIAGSKNSVYLENNGYGFQIGQQLSFKVNGRDYCSVILTDNLMTDVYVGLIGQKIAAQPPDTYSYKVDAPNQVGFHILSA